MSVHTVLSQMNPVHLHFIEVGNPIYWLPFVYFRVPVYDRWHVVASSLSTESHKTMSLSYEQNKIIWLIELFDVYSKSRLRHFVPRHTFFVENSVIGPTISIA